MIVENRENVSEGKIIDENNVNVPELQFTGNWFIDAGILGFVNLMEEIYGWDLKELRNKINENPENVYYGYFPFAYLFYHSKVRSNFKESRNIRNKIRDFYKKRDEKNKELSEFIKSHKINSSEKLLKKDLNRMERLKSKIIEFESRIDELNLKIDELSSDLIHEKNQFSGAIKSNIEEILSNSEDMFIKVKNIIDGLIVDFDLNLPSDHRNFFLYNPKKDLFFGFLYLYYLLKKDFSQIKLIRTLKSQESFIEFINFCEEIRSNPKNLVATIGDMLNQSQNKKKIIMACTEKFFLDSKNKEILEKHIYKKIQGAYGEKDELSSYETSPDSTINPFFYSPKEFFNIGYTMPLTLSDIEIGLKIKFPVYLTLLSFGRSFQFFSRRNILFYTNNLDLSYSINKGIQKKISMRGKKDSLFKITWSSIIDELIENKAKFSLENMYLIEFEGIENQKLKDVKYLGISKLCASIIIDDDIRESLNSNIQVSSGKNSEWIWILEKLIENKPLFPYILRQVILRINKNTNQKAIKSILYSLSVDAKIKFLAKNTKGDLFSQSFSLELEDAVFQIKESYTRMSLASKKVSEVFSQDKKDKIIYNLFSAMKRQNKHAFVNIFLKSFLELDQKDPKLVKDINNYIFNNIVQNEENWENYALAMIVGLL